MKDFLIQTLLNKNKCLVLLDFTTFSVDEQGPLKGTVDEITFDKYDI